ncbi:MAG TPA: cold-shock protein [Gemmatimonadaceae bacterium]|nr:cold-shock protein [Gemmatimonadaceae bacterium]
MRITGTVRWFNDAQGCGFISPDDGTKDCFVRGSEIAGFRTLSAGEAVEFELVQGAKGPMALNVSRAVEARRHG